MPFYPALPQPVQQKGWFAPLALGAAAGSQISSDIMRNRALSQKIGLEEQKQKALQQYGKTGDASALMSVDPEAAVKVSAEQRKAAGEWFDQSKWMVKDKPENFGVWRQQAVKMFGSAADAYIPKEYPGSEWFTKHEDYLNQQKKTMSEHQAADIAVKQDRYETDAQYKARRLAQIDSTINLDAARTGALTGKYGAETDLARARTTKAESEIGKSENYTDFADGLRANNTDISEAEISKQWNQRFQYRKTPSGKDKKGTLMDLLGEDGAQNKPTGTKPLTGATVLGGRDARQFKDAVMTDPKTGVDYKSDGKQWIATR